jgi:nucleotidyltransferase substrate binding protein (TIGR01987 family)
MNHQAQIERFEERKQDFIDCVNSLNEAVQQPFTSFIRDSVIKRYECCWETGWKLLKLWLSEQGIMAVTPRDVWKEAFAIGLLTGHADIWTQAQRMRNLTVHTYDEAVAEEVYHFICEEALMLFEKLKKKVLTWTIS